MKTIYGNLLKTMVLGIFSLTLSLNLHPLTGAEIYENQITAAMGKTSTLEKITAMNGLVGVMGNVDAETAREINPEFTTALTTLYTEAQSNPAVHTNLQTLLTNASNTSVLDSSQKATIMQWLSSLTPQSITGLASPSLPVASADSVVMNQINVLNSVTDETQRLERVFDIIQDSQGHTFSPATQEAFGKLLEKMFNNVSDIYAYMQQTLSEVSTTGTPLLTKEQIDYVKQQMLPRIGASPLAQDAQPEPQNKKATKKAKKGKKNKLKKGKKAKKAAASNPTQTAATTTAPTTEAAPTATAKKKKGKKKKLKKAAKDKKSTTKKAKKGKKNKKKKTAAQNPAAPTVTQPVTQDNSSPAA